MLKILIWMANTEFKFCTCSTSTQLIQGEGIRLMSAPIHRIRDTGVLDIQMMFCTYNERNSSRAGRIIRPNSKSMQSINHGLRF